MSKRDWEIRIENQALAGKKLEEEFPSLMLGERGKPLWFGLECGAGWYYIVREALLQIEAVCKNEDLAAKVIQIKQKWGLLEIYLNHFTESLYAPIKVARIKSETICETCGVVLKREPSNWLNTNCTSCTESRNK